MTTTNAISKRAARFAGLAVISILSAAYPSKAFTPALVSRRQHPRSVSLTQHGSTLSYSDDSSISSSWLPSPFSDTYLDDDDDHHIQQKLPRGSKPVVTVVESSTDFDNFLQQDDRLAVVDFHAAWCKSCQKFGLLYNHLASEMADMQKDREVVRAGQINMASVEWGKNTALCRSLGIKRLPTVQFYYKGQVLNSFPCGPKNFRRLEDEIQKYLQMTNEELLFEAEMFKGQTLLDTEVTQTENHQGPSIGDATAALAAMRQQQASPSSDSLKSIRNKRGESWWDWKF